MSDTTEKIEKLFCLAQDCFHELDLKAAIQSLKALLQIDFNHLDAHFLLAIIHQKDQAFELSNEHFRYCLEHNYKHHDIHKLIAMNQINLALYKGALYELQKHLKEYPNDDEAYALMGDIYTKQQEYTYALKVYTQAIELSPQTASYYLKRALTYKNMQSLQEAITEAKKALALEPHDAKALFLLGNLYDAIADYAHASFCYQDAIHLQPNIALYHNHLAIALSYLGEHEQARQAQAEAIRLEPQHQQYLKNLSNL